MSQAGLEQALKAVKQPRELQEGPHGHAESESGALDARRDLVSIFIVRVTGFSAWVVRILSGRAKSTEADAESHGGIKPLVYNSPRLSLMVWTFSISKPRPVGSFRLVATSPECRGVDPTPPWLRSRFWVYSCFRMQKPAN